MNKLDIVRAVRSALPSDHSAYTLSDDNLISSWFVSKRSARGLQLSEAGYSAFTAAEIEYADRKIEYSRKTIMIHNDFTLELSRKLHCPYYLHNSETTGNYELPAGYILDSTHKQTASVPMIRLYDTRLVTWIDIAGGIGEYISSTQLPKS